MKIAAAFFLCVIPAATLLQAQTETGTSAGAQALDEARSRAISAGPVQPADAGVSGDQEEKWWSVNVSTGWDSLYMFRGVNILGNGNGIYWVGGDFGAVPWENGKFAAGTWYGVGSWWNGANAQNRYAELDIFANYTHSFGPLDLTAGWVCYYYPNTPDAANRQWTVQNELMLGASYDIQIGKVTLTPSTTYYYELGPQWGAPHGLVNGGSSYWLWQLAASIPVARDGAVSLAPYTSFGINFGNNNRATDTSTVPVTGSRFTGGNNWQTGLALPVQFSSWFGVSPYIAYSYQWQNLYLENIRTAVNTWWCGLSANFSF